MAGSPRPDASMAAGREAARSTRRCGSAVWQPRCAPAIRISHSTSRRDWKWRSGALPHSSRASPTAHCAVTVSYGVRFSMRRDVVNCGGSVGARVRRQSPRPTDALPGSLGEHQVGGCRDHEASRSARRQQQGAVGGDSPRCQRPAGHLRSPGRGRARSQAPATQVIAPCGRSLRTVSQSTPRRRTSRCDGRGTGGGQAGRGRGRAPGLFDRHGHSEPFQQLAQFGDGAVDEEPSGLRQPVLRHLVTHEVEPCDDEGSEETDLVCSDSDLAVNHRARIGPSSASRVVSPCSSAFRTGGALDVR